MTVSVDRNGHTALQGDNLDSVKDAGFMRLIRPISLPTKSIPAKIA